MELQEIKFTSIFNVGESLNTRARVEDFLVKMFGINDVMQGKTNGSYSPIIAVKEYALYNVDFDFVVYSYIEWLKEEGVQEEELANVLLLFRESDQSAKNGLLFMHILQFYGLVTAPKKSYYYVICVYENTRTQSYFSTNSIGMSQRGIDNFIGAEMRVKFIDKYAFNQDIKNIAIGQKKAKTTREDLGYQSLKIKGLDEILEEYNISQ